MQLCALKQDWETDPGRDHISLVHSRRDVSKWISDQIRSQITSRIIQDQCRDQQRHAKPELQECSQQCVKPAKDHLPFPADIEKPGTKRNRGSQSHPHNWHGAVQCRCQVDEPFPGEGSYQHLPIGLQRVMPGQDDDQRANENCPENCQQRGLNFAKNS